MSEEEVRAVREIVTAALAALDRADTGRAQALLVDALGTLLEQEHPPSAGDLKAGQFQARINRRVTITRKGPRR